jgi:hypothetical protein
MFIYGNGILLCIAVITFVYNIYIIITAIIYLYVLLPPLCFIFICKFNDTSVPYLFKQLSYGHIYYFIIYLDRRRCFFFIFYILILFLPTYNTYFITSNTYIFLIPSLRAFTSYDKSLNCSTITSFKTNTFQNSE